MKHFRLFLLLIALPFAAVAQPVHFDRLDINDGLSQNSVTAILQDARGFMWFGTKDGLNRYDGHTFRVFKHNPHEHGGLGNSLIKCLAEDSRQRIWIGTDSGLSVYDPTDESFRSIPLLDAEGRLIAKPVQSLDCDRKGCVWISVDNNGIFCCAPEADTAACVYRAQRAIRSLRCDDHGVIWFAGASRGGLFYTEDRFATVKPFRDEAGKPVFPDDIISFIYFTDYNKMYLGLEEHGVAEVDIATGSVTQLPLSEGSLFVRHIIRYGHELWIGGESGIHVYDLRTHAIRHLYNSPYDPYSLSDNAVYSLCQGREGGLWIGSFFGGINFLPARDSDFDKYYRTDLKTTLQGRRVREICPDGRGRLWIGTEDAGLWHFDPATRTFEQFAPSREFSNVHGLLMDGDRLWVSTFSKGIRVIDTRTGAIRKYDSEARPGHRLFSNYVFALCRTRAGEIYVGTMHGLQRYDRRADGFPAVAEINNGKMVNDIREDSAGNLWVATFSNGVYRRDASTGAWRQFLHDDGDDRSLPCNNITSIFEDSRRDIWFTTEGSGFCRIGPDGEHFTVYDSTDGMPSDVVFQIVEDEAGFFWITTNCGLVLFDPHTAHVRRIYTVDDRLLCNQFNYKSSCRTDDGVIYFGCIEGLISFRPQLLTDRKADYVPPVYITEFSLDDRSGAGAPLLQRSILCTDTLCLNHNQNSWSLQLAVLDYRNSQTDKLFYKLDGYDDEWRKCTRGTLSLAYSKLPYGRYTFRVRLSDDMPDESVPIVEKRLFIRIRPPFYRTTAAYIGYALLTAGLILLALRLHGRRNARRQQAALQAFEREKERELYNAKIGFFTNVAHEIRTPLTLIKGPLENILAKEGRNPEIAEELDIMNRNTNRLMDLIDELLNFRKIEKERMSLHFERYDIRELVEETFYRFSFSAKQQRKTFELQADDGPIPADIDKGAFIKILSNLLNNALKYSEQMIRMEVRRSDDALRITVVNDGELVPDELRETIFTPFFRPVRKAESSGTGIGLPLARSLAELHGGTLAMGASRELNEFVLTLPLERPAAAEVRSGMADEGFDSLPDEEPADGEAAKTRILVVEDNAEMQAFIRRQLSESYSVLTADNGIRALEVLGANDVRLVISDVMMPKMDGIELCNAVKNDLRYCHIPLILLTAKTNIESKISGMEAGADAYIEKPFSPDYLLSVVANLLRSRQVLSETYAKNPLVLADTMATSPTDRNFIVRLQEIIHENFSNPDFKMNDIAEMLHMSRASFYRKIKGVLDMTPNDYLRLERLKMAAQLLKDKRYHVNEVCYMVGFSSTSYFTKCFQKQFGVLPKKFEADLERQAAASERRITKNPIE